MLKVYTEKWGQNEESLRQQALKEAHPRSRERLLALYDICRGQNATQVGIRTGRNPQTVMGWVHRYNAEGPESMRYRHSGGYTSVLSSEVQRGLDQCIREALSWSKIPPQKRQGSTPPRWTLKRLVAWVKEKFNIECCRETVRKCLKKLGFSWKKARKLLNKANPNKRAEYIETLNALFEELLRDNNHLLIYIDEAHIHLDTDEGYGWSIQGERFWISSSSPGRAKVSFYGIYLYNLGKVKILPYDCANGLNTIEVLNLLRQECPSNKMTVVWDGAPYHRSTIVKEAAENLNINIQPLPGYSPDFMPVEHLWQWLREDVTYHTCYDTKQHLISQVEVFEKQVNASPHNVADRLWTQKHLDPLIEKLRVST